MASYDQWNDAIIEYFTSNVEPGAPVFLSLDDEVVGTINVGSERSDDAAVQDFVDAVRGQWVKGRRVDLGLAARKDRKGVPRCAGFLAAMVLAASRMAVDDDQMIDDSNYFARLREILGIEGLGRPQGLLPAGIEEGMWLTWSKWLRGSGLVSTAVKGEGPWAFISYPISQTILREGDKQRLTTVFADQIRQGRLPRRLDRPALGAWIRNPSHASLLNRRHLRDIIEDEDSRRLDALIESAFDIYVATDAGALRDAGRRGARLSTPRLYGGLYRTEDVFTGDVKYLLYAQQSARAAQTGLSIRRSPRAAPEPLVPDRRGWYRPLWEIQPDSGGTYSVEGDERVKELIVAKRSFWILVQDEESPNSGVYANWRPPEPAELFLLLCKGLYDKQMKILREADLVRWSTKSTINCGGDEWSEYHDCMILSHVWDEVLPMRGCEDLCDELRPAGSMTIAFEGGLRHPRRKAWMDGFQPQISVYSFRDSLVLLRVTDDEGAEVFHDDVEANTRTPLPTLPAGRYFVEAITRGRCMASKMLEIDLFANLDCRIPDAPCSFAMGPLLLRGPRILNDKEV